MNKILNVNNLSVKYGKYEILKNINFSIEKGDYIGIVGPNGAGKTTLVKALLGLVPLENGNIQSEIDKHSIGYLPQLTSVNHKSFPASVEEIILTGLLSQKKFPKKFNDSDHRKVHFIMEKLNIQNLKDHKIGSLSGGQQQRVFLARALVKEPSILILDEPTSALDPKVRSEFYELLNNLNERDKITILLISHDVSTIGKYSKKMMYIDKQLIFFGNYEEFCKSNKMTEYFGFLSQHQICWRHGDGECDLPNS